jgi:hypothetical protein
LSPSLFERVWASIVVQQEHFLGPFALPPLLYSAVLTGHNVTVGAAVHCRALRKPVNEPDSLCVPKDRCQIFSTCQRWSGLFWRRTVVMSPLQRLLFLLRYGIAEPRLITCHQTSKKCHWIGIIKCKQLLVAVNLGLLLLLSQVMGNPL